MLVFTLRMIIIDIQKIFHGFLIIPYIIILGFITELPFFESGFLLLAYMIILSFDVISTHITKIFYVLPLGRKLLRRYIHLRVIILSSLLLLEGGIITLISHKWTVANIKGGWLMTMFYVMLIIFMSISNIEVAYKKRTRNIIAFVAGIVLISGNLINAMLSINFRFQLLISIISVIIAEALLIMLNRKSELKNYAEPVYYGLFSGAWRTNLTQNATRESKNPK